MKIVRSLLMAGVFGLASLSLSNAAAADQPTSTPPTPATQPAEPAKPDAVMDSKPDDKSADPAATPKAQEKLVYCKMVTNKGEVILELNNEKAPISVQNFLAYVDEKHYDGTIFHRVIPTFMIQGGGFTEDMSEKKTKAPIKNEWKNGLKNVKGTLAMARRPIPDSATCQFFINVTDNSFLDQPQPDGAAYAVFGRVIGGMDVVDKIKLVKTTRKGQHEAVPVETVTITSIARISEEDAKKVAGN